MPEPSSAMRAMAASSWAPQSQRREAKTSPVRHWEWTRTSTGSAGSMAPITSATCSSPVTRLR